MKHVLLLLLLFLSAGCLEPIQRTAKTYTGDNISIASWNLQIYGESKEDKAAEYASYMKKYDIVFVQEIRSKDSGPFNTLCAEMVGYKCLISSRAGTTSSKEQYGVFYKEGIEVADINDYNEGMQSAAFERPPYAVMFNVKTHTPVGIWVAHTKPENAAKEISALYSLTNVFVTEKIVLGDLNADCDYYKRNPDDFPDSEWNWVIDDYKDTTSGATNCAYDRIIATDNINIVSSGVVETPKSLSDHYLVYAIIGGD